MHGSLPTDPARWPLSGKPHVVADFRCHVAPPSAVAYRAFGCMSVAGCEAHITHPAVGVAKSADHAAPPRPCAHGSPARRHDRPPSVVSTRPVRSGNAAFCSPRTAQAMAADSGDTEVTAMSGRTRAQLRPPSSVVTSPAEPQASGLIGPQRPLVTQATPRPVTATAFRGTPT